ncbi:hypothetical protein J2X19_000951 [Rhodoferax ferrireducens]|uniref:BioF2-like acetyltransferase domain-containing protein n=1 Tax=Rhodoferax ferrireducens TaxID=192843 RepID=A0ABU2C4N7_9BURK|nr:GNAT family N-acetyltransferase [Rhodoferax ferrireducens]MDR7376293.1 hypothetical protein [Rhodoferax ferrireducens]
MTIQVRPFEARDADAWDSYCGQALQGTFLHTRRFLSYHGDRFVDQSLILECDKKWVGLFPAASDPVRRECIISHPGITYGGLLHCGQLQGSSAMESLRQIQAYYRQQGFQEILYKAVPAIYHRAPAQDDLYALFRLGAVRVRADLSCTIDLQQRLRISSRRGRGLRKALAAGVEMAEGHTFLPALWEVLADNLQRKHQAVPVHSLAEISLLAERFPQNVRCVVARWQQKIVAGVLLFNTPSVHHAQYIASSAEGYRLSALDAIFDNCITMAIEAGCRWFDFGTSNEQGGTILNNSLYEFKSEFGGGGVVHEFYTLRSAEGL